MARKMGRNLKMAAAGLMACAAVALCAVSPAWGEERAGDVVNVTVPTRIDCALGADGTVTSPGGLEVVNNGPQDLYVAASTVDDFGQKVEFAIDLGGSPLLSRAGGKDVEGEVEFAGSSRKGLGLAVSKLNRTSHAALMDAAAQGEAPMFTVGFRFTFKALQGTMAISGEAKLGKTLTATVSGAQADAKLAYRWYRDGQLIAGAETASYTTNEADQGKKLKCEAYDAAGRYVGGVSAEVGPIKGPEAFAVFSADDGSLNFYNRKILPMVGEIYEGKTATNVYTNLGNEVRYTTIDNIEYPIGPWYDIRNEIKSIAVIDNDIQPTYIDGWFSYIANCSEIVGFNKLNLSRTKSMRYLFLRNTGLKKIDMSNLYAPHCEVLGGLFEDCSNLTEVNISNLTAGKSGQTQIWFMFAKCFKLQRVDMSGWDIGQITTADEIFQNCVNLREVIVSKDFTWQDPDGYLPTPNANHIPGADGYWYDVATGEPYKPEEIPSNKAATYVAVNPVKAPTVTISGEAIYGSTLTARVSGQPADTTATSYQWQFSIDGKNWRDSQYQSAKTESITLVMNGEFSPENNYYRCVVTTTAGKKRVPQGISEAVGPVVKQQLTGSVRIDGEPIVGATLNAVPQGVQSDAKLAYQWYRTSEKSTLLSSGFTHSHGSNDSIVGPTINVTEKGELSFKVRAAFGDKPNTAAAFNVELRSAPSGKVMLTRSFSPSIYKDDNIKIQLDAGVYEFTTSYSSGIANYAPESTSSINIFVADIYFSSAITDKIAGATYPTYTVADSDLGTAISCHITDASGKYASGVASDPVGPVGPDTREAFAVYSADDGSLNFYKRSEVPRTGSQFEGKTATRVYTDIETMFVYNFMDIPWLNVMQEIRSSNVVDSITPINTVFWFYEAKNLLRADLSRLDTSRMDAMDAMFYRCHSLETVDLGTWSASSVNSLIDMFMSCTSLKTVDVSHLDTRNVTHMNSMFGDCSSLVELDISNFDMSNVVEDTNMLYKLRSLKKLTIGAKCSLSPKSGLSVPSAESIPGADGKWYAASDGRGYATADIPSNKVDTYYASKSLLPVVADESPDVVMPGVESVMDVANTEADSVVEVDAIDSEAVVPGEVENEEAERKPDEGVGAGSDGNEKQDESGSEIESAAGTPPEEEEPVPVTSDEAQ